MEHAGRTAGASCVRLDTSVGEGVEPDNSEVVGLLFAPPGDGRHPPVRFLGGAEGGFHRRHPALIARHGFAVLSLAYFRHARQPNLVEVPLKGFERALRWLLAQPRVEGRRAAVFGGSFGGQAASLVAATYPELAGAVVTLSGSGVVTSGIPGHPTLLENFQDARLPGRSAAGRSTSWGERATSSSGSVGPAGRSRCAARSRPPCSTERP